VKAGVYRVGLVFLVSSKGPASSSMSSTDLRAGLVVAAAELVVLGSKLTVGIAQSRRAMLSQNGSQRFLLMVKAARVGPMKDTM
jgi:hypothetical protein